MKMGSKFIGAFVGMLAIVAMSALPAAASAEVVTLRTAGQGLLSTGAPVLGFSGTSSGVTKPLITTTEHGLGPKLECEEVALRGEVSANNAEPAEVSQSATEESTTAGCHGSNGAPVVITSIAFGPIKFKSNTTDESFLTFTYDIITGPTTHLMCHFEGTALTTWNSVNNIDTVDPSTLVGTGDTGCPVHGEIEGEIELSSEGEALELSHHA